MTQAGSFSEPATNVQAITPSDSTDLTGVRYVYVGGAGNLAVRMINDPSTTVTINAVTAGSLLPLRVTRIMAATTATNITGLR